MANTLIGNRLENGFLFSRLPAGEEWKELRLETQRERARRLQVEGHNQILRNRVASLERERDEARQEAIGANAEAARLGLENAALLRMAAPQANQP